jgi:hypothetical protein
MRSCGIGAILALALVSTAWSYGYLGVGLGSGVFQASTRCGGMGEVSMLCDDSPFAVTLNPALLGGMNARQVALAYHAVSLDENWAFPVYDSFDAILGYDTYSANSKIYHDFEGGLASGSISQAFGTCFAVALVPAYDLRYDYAEEVRDRNPNAQPPDRVIANNFIRSRGELRSLSFGLGKTLCGGLALGAGMDYLYGKHDLEKGISFVDENRVPWSGGGLDTVGAFSASGLTGTRFTVGARYTMGERVDFGAAYKSGVELEGDFCGQAATLLGFGTGVAMDQGKIKIKYPASYALGVSIHPRNGLLTVIEGDVILAKWSDAKDATGVGGTSLNDTYEWHFGVEHVFYNQRPLRFGFLYRPSPKDKETSEAAVTTGTGFKVAGLDIDLAASVGWREYREPDLFFDDIFGAKLRGSTDLVRETVMGGVISISRRF